MSNETNEQGEQVKVTVLPSGAVIRELLRDPLPVPVPVKSWPAFDWYRRFSQAERIAIRTLAQTDAIATDIMTTLDHAIASGSNVRADDPDTINGLAYLTSAGVLAMGRSAELLA